MLPLTSTRWNGRQIRNAFQTAIALAEFDATEDMHRRFGVLDVKELPASKARVTVDHFRKVAAAASGFDRYLKEVYSGRDEADRAFGESLRKDDWGTPPIASMRPPMKGNNSQGYQQQVQYRHQQQRPHAQDTYYSEPSFDNVDPFQDSKRASLPNEIDKFARSSPDARMIDRADTGSHDQLSGYHPSNPQSPWGTDDRSGGSVPASRIQHAQNGRPRNIGSTQYDESEYQMQTTNEFGELDELGLHKTRSQVRDSGDRQRKFFG